MLDCSVYRQKNQSEINLSNLLDFCVDRGKVKNFAEL